MMTGPENQAEAERMGRLARACADPAAALVSAQLATTHAILALACGTAMAPAAPATDLDALRLRITAIHYEVDGSPSSEGSCIADGSDWPCPTVRALDAPASGESPQPTELTTYCAEFEGYDVPDDSDDSDDSIHDVYSASELYEMDQATEFALDAADEALDAERGDDE